MSPALEPLRRVLAVALAAVAVAATGIAQERRPDAEFGRTPFLQGKLGGADQGRDHHPYAFTQWMAGGGIKPGYSHGATDEFGFEVVADPVHVHDFQATLLHLLGIDHQRLTWRFQGRRYRLTDVHGRVVPELLA